MKNKNHIFINIIVVLAMIISAIYSLYLFSPPAAVSQDAPLSSFSAERAMKHVEEMCQQPHFIGTEEHRRVREYIVSEAEKLGLATEIQETTAVHYYHHRLISARVHNVIAILKGTASSKGVLVVGHYDSMLHAPGAADDGSAAAAMLETARALTHSPPLKNDIIFLFTDGEEVGLMGAKAFVTEYPLLKNIGVVFNLEARGSTGTSVTFEVSSENGWIMEEYAKAVPYPFAASIMYEVYKRMPNDTDFTIFKKAGCSGFNAAFVEGFVNYHSMTDTPENLNPESLQHQGSYILNIANHFGNISIDNTKETDVVFFNPIGSWLVIYPGWLNLPLVILVLLLYSLYLGLGIKKKQMTIKGILGGVFIYLSSIVLICVISWLVQSGIKSLYPHYGHFYSHNFYNVHFYFYLLAGLVVGLFSTLYFLLFSKFKAENLLAGALTLFMVIMIFLYLEMSTAAYLVIFPLIFILLAGIISLFFNFSEDKKYTGYVLIFLLAVLPVIFLYVPLIKMLFMVFSLGMSFVGVLLLLLLLGFLILQLKTAYNINKFALPVLAVLVVVAAFVGGHLTSVTNKEQPLHSNIIYCLDADQQKALWASGYLQPDDWNRQFFTNPRIESLTDFLPGITKTYLKNGAPLVNLPEPVVKILADDIENDKRKLHFNLSSSREASSMILFFQQDAGITGIKIDGKPIDYKGFYSLEESDYHSMYYWAVPPEGIDFVVECEAEKTLQLVVVEGKLGLPLIPGVKYTPMPAHIIPDMEFSHVSLLKKTFLL
ncbi:MAG: M20/M25/M40 family metallo-hydrolase [Candidatus Aminicenantes bacterium]|jgi:hypothetical protein